MEEKSNNAKKLTTIWQKGSDGDTLVKTISGFPFGTPSIGTSVDTPNYGKVLCTGHKKSGLSETFDEIKFTIK